MRRRRMSAPAFTHARYRQLLRAAGAGGYRFAGFGELVAPAAADARLCLLRHDCDNDLVAAARLAEIEAEEEVRSTFFLMLRSALYNLLAPTGRDLVGRILEHGHWLGLHFDESVVDGEPDARVAELVDRERQVLREEFGQEIRVVSFHQPGRRILENRIKLSCLNTYDRQDMADVHYTSDSNLVFRGGEPEALFAEGSHSRIQILIHPEWWTAEPMPLAAKWDRMLLDNLEVMQESLLRREDTYTERREITVRSAERN
jgi:peptidoglycan/xylan/chitin deacetylase (PgdA/CDA1 family)